MGQNSANSNELVVKRLENFGDDDSDADCGNCGYLNEQFGVFDHKNHAQSGRWYILPSSGHTPLARVGHAAVFLAPSDGKNGTVVSVGGANPDGTFSEVNILDLNTLRWDLAIPANFRPRYEHSAFCLPGATSQTAEIYVFGGADQVDNMNDVQIIDLAQRTCRNVDKTTGSPPGERTYRCHSALNGQLFVYGGGRQGSDPVSDKQTRVFDTASSSWSSIDAKGQTPKSRQGHSCVALAYESPTSKTDLQKVHRRCLVVHGGMAGSTFYDDLHVLDLDASSWSEVKLSKSKPKPSPRAAHVALPYNGKMIVFGGLDRNGKALNDLWVFDVAERHWKEVSVEGSAPPARLDAAACIINSLVPRDCQAEGDENISGADYLLIFGGMDTEGDVFSDCFVFRLDALLNS